MRSLVLNALILLLVLTGVVGTEAVQYKFERKEIERMSPQMQDTFAGLQYLLNPYQTRQFLSLDNELQRVQWMELFWRQRDPTPTTRKNEMEVEHNIRVKLARQFYKSKKWPGWDKRGEVFIRYGPPNYRGKIWAEINVRGMDPPGELWYYTRHNMLVSFQNFGLKGEYIYSIDPLGPTTNFSPELTEFLLYDTDESLANRIPQQYLEYYSAPAYTPVPQSAIPGREEAYIMDRPRELEAGIDALMDPDLLDMLPKNVSTVFQRDQIREVANNFEIVLKETPSSYPFNFERKELTFYFAVDQFRAGRKTNRVDISLELPVSIDEEDRSTVDETYHVEVVVWDSQYREISRRETDIVVRADKDVTKWSSLVPTQLMVGLEEGYYRMGLSMRGEKSGRSSSYRTTFACEPFGLNLGISDILFARSIDQANTSSMFTRGPLEVVPHPLRAYSRSFPMPIYFELYNLTLDDRGVSTYTLEYKIIPHTKEKRAFWDRFQKSTPVVSSKFQSSGFSAHETQYLFIHTDNLHKGSYDLLITLTDDFTRQVVFQKGTFSLID
jgi:GWxTD domain-containing protein